jgi:hypothetical protein
MCSISQSCDLTFDVNCGPRSEVIVSGTPKRIIQEKTKARSHAAVDVSEREIASIHLDMRSMIVKMCIRQIMFIYLFIYLWPVVGGGGQLGWAHIPQMNTQYKNRLHSHY